MQKHIETSPQSYPPHLWRTPVRIMHWLIALFLLGATSLTQHGDSGHSEMGWAALFLLLVLPMLDSRSNHRHWATWFISALLTAVNLTNWLLPDHSSHTLLSLSMVAVAAFYISTVVFEILSLMTKQFFIDHRQLR